MRKNGNILRGCCGWAPKFVRQSNFVAHSKSFETFAIHKKIISIAWFLIDEQYQYKSLSTECPYDITSNRKLMPRFMFRLVLFFYLGGMVYFLHAARPQLATEMCMFPVPILLVWMVADACLVHFQRMCNIRFVHVTSSKIFNALPHFSPMFG